MKNILNKLRRDETGQAFIIVLILLVLGGLIIGPLLAYMNTGLIAGQAYEQRMDELYAADAGVEDALWQIKNKTLATLFTDYDPDDYVTEYHYPDYLEVNDKDVDVAIQNINEITYRIESTATSPDTGSSTSIESYINILSFANFMDNAITSMSDVGLQPNTTVNGDVQLNGSFKPDPPLGTINDPDGVSYEEIEGWPTADDLHLYYWPDVENLPPFPDATIDLKDTTEIPTLYGVGDLTITNTGEIGASATLALDGTVYVTGNLEFKQTGNKDYEIHLNYATIFALGEINFPSDRCTLYGPGCIIAMGDINFQPSMESVDMPPDPPPPAGDEDFIFVMSVDGFVDFSPRGNFYGSLAGNTEVNLQPGCTLTWNGPPPDLKYPGADPSEKNVISSILTWEIILQ